MRPALKTALVSRQTGESAARLLAWVEQNQALLAHHGASLRDDVESLILDVASVGPAIEAPPCVGVLGLAGSRPHEIITAMIGKVARTEAPELDASDIAETLAAAVLLKDGDEPSCVTVRHSAATGTAASRDFPIACTLLSELDIVKILARAYLAHVPAFHRDLPSAAEIGALFEDASRRLSPEAVPGPSRREIVDLREHLNTHHPRSRILGALLAAGYWDDLAEMVSHLDRPDRQRAFAVLWRDEPAFTSLYQRLADCLERVGPGLEVSCATDAMLEASGRRGALVRHPRCITDTATLLALASDEADPVRVVNRYNKEAAIGRAELAALVAEMEVEWGSSRHSPFEAMKILQLPSSNPVTELPLGLYVGRKRSEVPLDALARFFARIKSSYLFERACRRAELTSLMVCVDPRAGEDETLAPLIGDWIELAQGSDAAQRERTKTGLFVIETQPGQSPDGEPVIKAAAPADWDERLGAMIAGGLGSEQDWPREWTPGRPFDNVFAFRRVSAEAPEPRDEGTDPSAIAPPGETAPIGSERGNVLPMPILFRRFDGMRAPRKGKPGPGAGTATFVRGALLPVTGLPIKNRQLETQLSELRRRLRGRLRRHHLSNDPVRTAEWRRQVANVAQSRLQRCAESGRLGHLLEALTVSEDEFAILFRRVTSRPAVEITPPSKIVEPPPFPLEQGGGGALTLATDAEAVACEAHAAAAVAFWARSARQRIRSARLCRHIRVPQSVLQHVVDELTIGAGRVGLASKLAEALLKGRTGGSEEDTALRLATYAARIIGAFVESLDATGRRREALATSGLLADSIGTGGEIATTTAKPRPPTRISGKSFADLWCARFSALVEANIAAAPLLTGTMEKDRELGEILALLVSTPSEVEL